MDEITRLLVDYYGKENKNDFYTSYLYMKFLQRFEGIVMENMGLPVNPKIEKIDPALEEMLKAYVEDIGESNASAETNLYHSKVVQLHDAKKIVTLEVDIHVEVPETIVPFRLARDVILRENDTIAVGTCPCRYAQEECNCMPPPMEACMFVGDPHASFMAEHNSMFRKITRDEAVQILEDCHNKGFVHCAYFKKDMGNRLFAICNCCSCCCGAVKIHDFLASNGLGASSLVGPSGYVAQVGKDCTGCGDCIEACQFGAILMDDDALRADIQFEKCMGCGVCENVCPAEAITLRVEPAKGGVLDLDELKKT